jgi:2-dehydro-3-deoxygluconokinase
MMKCGSVVGFGEMLLRLKAPGAQRLLQTDVLEASFGGAEFNVLASLSQLDYPCQMVTALPNNSIGAAALQELRRYSVGTQYVQRLDGRMGLYFLESAADLRPGQVVYDRADSAFTRQSGQQIDWQSVLDGARWLHLTGITAALGDQPWTAMLAAAQTARRLDVPVSFDVNMRQSLWAGSKRSARDAMRPLLDLASVIFAGPGDWSVCLDDPAPMLDSAETTAVFLEQMIATHPCANAIVSGLRIASSAEHHALSVIARTRDAVETRSRTIEIRHVIDRVGAGDALVAGCLAGVLDGLPWRDTLDRGVMAGALKHSIAGDVNRCSRAEIEAALANDRPGRLLR